MGINREEKNVADRRDFLKLASLGTIMTGATLVAGSPQASELEEQKGTGYRETAHVKTYYELAKF